MGPHTALSQKGPRVCWLQGLRPTGRHPRLRHSQRGPDISPYPVRLRSEEGLEGEERTGPGWAEGPKEGRGRAWGAGTAGGAS